MAAPLSELQWLQWAKKLEALSSTGLHYTRDQYDAERFAAMAQISRQMLAALGNVPLRRIENLVSDHATGYATPKVDVRAAVIRDNQILLVKEATDECWALPGGFADIGLSASQNVEKEVFEEAGIRVQATELYRVRHMNTKDNKPDVREFYKLMFICEPVDDARPVAGNETLDADYFGLDNLPPLSSGRVIREDIEYAFNHNQHIHSVATFD